MGSVLLRCSLLVMKGVTGHALGDGDYGEQAKIFAMEGRSAEGKSNFGTESESEWARRVGSGREQRGKGIGVGFGSGEDVLGGCICEIVALDMRAMHGILVIEESEALAEDKVCKEGPERGLTRIGPEGQEEEDGEKRASAKKSLKMFELEHGRKDGYWCYRKWEVSLATKERLKCVGGSEVDVGVGEWYIVMAVK